MCFCMLNCCIYFYSHISRPKTQSLIRISTTFDVRSMLSLEKHILVKHTAFYAVLTPHFGYTLYTDGMILSGYIFFIFRAEINVSFF